MVKTEKLSQCSRAKEFNVLLQLAHSFVLELSHARRQARSGGFSCRLNIYSFCSVCLICCRITYIYTITVCTTTWQTTLIDLENNLQRLTLTHTYLRRTKQQESENDIDSVSLYMLLSKWNGVFLLLYAAIAVFSSIFFYCFVLFADFFVVVDAVFQKFPSLFSPVFLSIDFQTLRITPVCSSRAYGKKVSNFTCATL